MDGTREMRDLDVQPEQGLVQGRVASLRNLGSFSPSRGGIWNPGSLNLTALSATVKPCQVSAHSVYFMAVKRSKSLVKQGRSLTESGELLPWELLYAEWLVRLQTRPSVDVQIASATELAREAGVLKDDGYITEQDLKRARLRKTWKRYFADLKSEGMRKARRMLVEHAPQYADAHIWSLHQARKYGDYKAASLIVHHTGKSGEDERGSSALRGAADTMVALKPGGAGMRFTCEKQKDAAEFKPWDLHLVESGASCAIEVGTDRGTDDSQMSPAEVEILAAVPAAFGTDWTSATKVREVSDAPKTSHYRALNRLVQRSFLEVEAPTKTRRIYRVTEAGRTALEGVPNGPN